jgi:FMN hydrolase / 5-amino-6-(5-phospho-D-ribitylamino)uracil phosphatase
MARARRSTRVTVISFDADDTLWDFQTAMRHSLALTLTELRRHVAGGLADRLDVDEVIRIRQGVAEEYRGTANLEGMRMEGFRRTLAAIGVTDDGLAHHLTRFYLNHRFNDIELFPDVVPALNALLSRYTLGLISNGNTYPDRCGLVGYFSFVIFAQDYGVEKPDRRIFEVAMREAGCTADQLLHVGDSLAADVKGAMDAGARAVWLNRQAQPNDSGITPDYEMATLSGLPSFCEGL